MTDKSGPYVVVEKDGKFIVDVPGLVLGGKSKSDAELWCDAFNDTYASGFKAGLERAARLAEERSPPWPPMVYSPTRGTGPAKIFTPSPRSKRFDGGVGPR